MARDRVYAFDENQRLDAHGTTVPLTEPCVRARNSGKHFDQGTWMSRAAPLHCPTVRVQCTQTRDLTRSRILRHMHARFTHSSSFTQSHATANWEVHPGEINEAPLQMNSWAAPSFARLWPLSRYIHVYIFGRKKRREKEAEKGKKIASRSELVSLFKKEFFFIAKSKYR